MTCPECVWDHITRANPKGKKCGRPAIYEVNPPDGYYVCGIHLRSAHAIGDVDFRCNMEWAAQDT